jgi:hypothetical protein
MDEAVFQATRHERQYKKVNMTGQPGERYAAASGRKYVADDAGFIADVDQRDLGDMAKMGCERVIEQPVPDNSSQFKAAPRRERTPMDMNSNPPRDANLHDGDDVTLHKAGDKLEK